MDPACSGHNEFTFNLGTFLRSNTAFSAFSQLIIEKMLVKYIIHRTSLEWYQFFIKSIIKPIKKDLISSAFPSAGMQSNPFYAFVAHDFQSLKAFAQHRAANVDIEFHMRFSQFYSRSTSLLIQFQIGNLSTFSKSQQRKANIAKKTCSNIPKGKSTTNGGKWQV